MKLKSFFKECSKAGIKRKKLVELRDGIAETILSLKSDEYTVVLPLVPPEFAVEIKGRYNPAVKFMKHGDEVKPKRYNTLEEALNDTKTPVYYRKRAFDSLKGAEFCAFSVMPLGRGRKRKYSLCECVEGARIYAYAHQAKAEIKIRAYDDAERVKIDGGSFIAEVPSRTQKRQRYVFRMFSVPVVDSNYKRVISQNFGTDHSCGSKMYSIRYKYLDDKETSRVVKICAHEIAAYLKLIEVYAKEGNIVPLEMCPFAIPSQLTVGYYLKLENNLLVLDGSIKDRDRLRKPNIAEKEILLWHLVKLLGHDKTFYSILSRDGRVADYNWKQEN